MENCWSSAMAILALGALGTSGGRCEAMRWQDLLGSRLKTKSLPQSDRTFSSFFVPFVSFSFNSQIRPWPKSANVYMKHRAIHGLMERLPCQKAPQSSCRTSPRSIRSAVAMLKDWLSSLARPPSLGSGRRSPPAMRCEPRRRAAPASRPASRESGGWFVFYWFGGIESKLLK